MHEEKGEIRQLLIHGKNNWQKRKNKEWEKRENQKSKRKKENRKKGGKEIEKFIGSDLSALLDYSFTTRNE